MPTASESRLAAYARGGEGRRRAGEEAPGGHVPAVVHHRVEHVALEPRRRVVHPVRPCLPPHLADEVGLRVDAPDEAPVVAPEAERYHLGHVQPEAVHAVRGIAVPVGVQPAPGDAEHQVPDAGNEVALDRAVGLPRRPADLLPLRQPRHADPSPVRELVGVRRGGVVEALDLVPVGEPRRPLVREHVPPGPEGDPGVVPGVVHDDAHAAAVDLAHQGEEEAVGGGPAPGGRVGGVFGRHAGLVAARVGSEVAVDVVVVPGVVLVQRGRVVHRVEIQSAVTPRSWR